MPICQLKELQNLKVENYVLFSGYTEDLSPGDSFSDNCEGLFWRGKGGARIYRSFCEKKPQKTGSWNIQKLVLIKENKTSQLINLVLFYVWEDARVWDH